MFTLKLDAKELLVLQLVAGNRAAKIEALNIAYSTISEHEQHKAFAVLWAKLANAEYEE